MRWPLAPDGKIPFPGTRSSLAVGFFFFFAAFPFENGFCSLVFFSPQTPCFLFPHRSLAHSLITVVRFRHSVSGPLQYRT